MPETVLGRALQRQVWLASARICNRHSKGSEEPRKIVKRRHPRLHRRECDNSSCCLHGFAP